jgi:5-methylcytosine-specific restriction endonuclease McrA
MRVVVESEWPGWRASCYRRNRRVEMMPSLTDSQRDHHLGPKADGHLLDLSFGPRTAECIAQCMNLEHEFHHTASKLCILGFEALK